MTDTNLPLTIRALQIALGDNDNGALEHANEYGEPGYSNPEKCILFANYNEAERTMCARAEARGKVRRSDDAVPTHEYEAPSGREAWRRFEQRLERLGYSLEWSDEWYVDGGRSPCRAYRTTPDGWGWESRVRTCDGYMLTPEDDAQEWIDDALNEESRPLPSWFDESELELRGFKAIDQDDKQVGFHPGQNETPDKFMPKMIKAGHEVILQITDRGQFDCRYKVWTRREAKDGILFDEASGTYIPQRFAREIVRERVTGVSEEDYAILENPDHESYWEVWDDVLRSAELTQDDGTVVTLEQDGSVFYREKGAEFCEHEDKHYVYT